MKRILLIVLSGLMFSVSFAQQNNVLVEVFTNSHCPLCPGAHNTLDSYDQNSPNADKVRYIFYHMPFPYSDDPLNQANTADPAARNNYYGPFSSTPRAFFEGEVQDNSYSSWAAKLDELTAQTSPLEINLSGTKNSDDYTINASITSTGAVGYDDLVIHFVAVEDVDYQGRNGVSPQKNVMRKMINSPEGESFTIGANETKTVDAQITKDASWIADNMSFVVFVQSASSKDVVQSEEIENSEFNSATDVNDNPALVREFKLNQNYPNPFNPSTNLSFTIGRSSFVSLKVFDILGNEVATLVNENKPAGEYQVEFNADASLPSGVYIYQLKAGNYTATKTMALLK